MKSLVAFAALAAAAAIAAPASAQTLALPSYLAPLSYNASLGYNIEPINTYVSLGVDNIFDKQPPLLYLNNVLNANTDVSTYDLLGRYYHASVTVKF